jgi:non-specific serine/threonine protein kinase
MLRVFAACFAVLGLCASAAAGTPRQWQQKAPLSAPRSEVAGTRLGNAIYVVGGFTPDGRPSARVDAYLPRTNTWRRLPDLPTTAHHAMAAGNRGLLYVVGGYGPDSQPLDSAYVLQDRRWTELPRMPEPRAAGGAVVLGEQIYVIGGVVRTGGRRLATTALRYDIATRRWSHVPGPTPREHLGVTAFASRIYAVAGRKAGFDTNLDLLESYRPGARQWRRLPPVPGKRGGTGAAAGGSFIVSVGGEQFSGTIRTVFGYNVLTGRWRRLPDLRTPRHGLAVVGMIGRGIYAIAGGRQPGLGGVTGTNELLTLR